MEEKIVQKQVNDILESVGKQDDLNRHSKRLAELIVSFLEGYIEYNKDSLYDGYEWEFSRKEVVETDYLKKNTLIGGIKLNVNYVHSTENKINGSFKKVQLLDDGYYLVFLEINIKINNSIKNYLNQIEYWVSHELHHAFRYIKTIDKNSKSNNLNWVKNKTNYLTKDYLRENPALKEFIDMVYLSLPQEIEARQQETASQLKYDKSENANKTFEYLMQFQPITDARRMLNYSTKNVLKSDKETLARFIKVFNQNLEKKGLNTWVKTDMNDFFKYWEGRIIESGGNLKRKIDRMISDKYLYENDSDLFDNVDLKILSEAYGIEFD